jgi:hypothetical protein
MMVLTLTLGVIGVIVAMFGVLGTYNQVAFGYDGAFGYAGIHIQPVQFNCYC